MTDYDASNPRHIRLQRNQARVEEDAHDVFINTVMGMVDGRAYIHDLLLYCRVFDQPYSVDSHDTAFACGQLDVGQTLLRRIMRICPDQYIQMMREANARDIADANRRSRSDKDSNGGDNVIPIYVHPGDDSPATTDSDEERGFGREDGGDR